MGASPITNRLSEGPVESGGQVRTVVDFFEPEEVAHEPPHSGEPFRLYSLAGAQTWNPPCPRIRTICRLQTQQAQIMPHRDG
jgi:hypothetical protein